MRPGPRFMTRGFLTNNRWRTNRRQRFALRLQRPGVDAVVGQLEAAGTAQQCKRACLPSAFFASRRGDWRGTTPVRSSSNSDPRTALVASFVIAPMAGRAAQPASGNDTARFLAGMQPGPDSPLLPLIKDRAWQQHAGRFNNIFAKVESRQISRIHTWSQAKLTSPSPVIFYMFSGPVLLRPRVLSKCFHLRDERSGTRWLNS